MHLADIGQMSDITISSGQQYLGLKVSEGDHDKLTGVAQSTLPAIRTEALVGVESVNAGPSIATGVAGAVIDILRGKQSVDQCTV